MGNYRKFTKSELKWISEFEKLMKSASCKNLFILVDDTIKVYPERKMDEFGSYLLGDLEDYHLINPRCLTDGGDY